MKAEMNRDKEAAAIHGVQQVNFKTIDKENKAVSSFFN